MIFVSCEQLLENPRTDCEVRGNSAACFESTADYCEGYTRCVEITTPEGKRQACPTCAEACGAVRIIL